MRRAILCNCWIRRNVIANWITSRSELTKLLVAKTASLSALGLDGLPDYTFTSVDMPDTFNIANCDHVQSTSARVMMDLGSKCGAPPGMVRTLFKNLTSEGTAAGYLAQFQGYEWLLDQGTRFRPEVTHAATLRGRAIDLDGEIISGDHSVFFDIKSFGFEPEYRDRFRRRLEQKLAGYMVSIDGPGNHSAEAIQAEAFGKLAEHCSALTAKDRIDIPALGWQVRKTKRQPGVTSSVSEYNPAAFIQENRSVPLRFASQFTTDAPYILVFVPPDGLGSSNVKLNVFEFSEKLVDGMAAHLFGPGRLDSSPANQYDSSVPNAVTTADAIARLSGIAFYSRQAKLALLHLNAKASAPISVTEAQSIASGWKVFEHS